ncbi:hypothetical protein [Methylobacterium gnaphalii]|uniref:Uncharacterized protein n=1 Tax=Methylobacterium gnaphalii TaxID=1010610 RepID=A0A512JPB0_9HYPH|nr:hypothetical protein [Methylobacterium gnaphalii]GEP11800.1 hypothetical protein MGN01_36450 [Methylobacterium gnaphalii]GJD69477.1 hypothetical protein MMMDOFMJ_2408 [Methylobacterium gnaphalii]GLS49565.1 hypothetical protein GCM10007885_24140 [Methylobacterium gnaphalii]
MSLFCRRGRRSPPPNGPDLLEPTDLPALDRALEGRAGAYGKDALAASSALSVLKSVRDGTGDRSREPHSARNFLGGVGLITRFGRSDTITAAGLVLLDNSGARP